jgi:hypothetical protein
MNSSTREYKIGQNLKNPLIASMLARMIEKDKSNDQ